MTVKAEKLNSRYFSSVIMYDRVEFLCLKFNAVKETMQTETCDVFIW